MTTEKLLGAVLSAVGTIALAVIGYFLHDVHDTLKMVQAEQVRIQVAQASFVTRDMLQISVREMRDEVGSQIKQLREDLPGIVRGAVSREQRR